MEIEPKSEWYCAVCKVIVANESVTYHELHEACGHTVVAVPVTPPTQSRQAPDGWVSVTPETMPDPITTDTGTFDNKDLLILHYLFYDSYEFGVWNGHKWEMPDVGLVELSQVDYYFKLPPITK